MRRYVLICGLVSLGVRAAVLPVVPGDSERGEKLFETERCVQCHGIDGKGGKTAPDLGRQVDRSFTPALLASTMWNHAPVMWAAIEVARIEKPEAYPGRTPPTCSLSSIRRDFSTNPATPRAVKKSLAASTARDCHGITESRAEGAPPVVKWESLGQPVLLVQQMWNHSGRMREAFARKSLSWQQLTTQDLTDMLLYLRNLPETKAPGFAVFIQLGARRRDDFPVQGLHQMPYR